MGKKRVSVAGVMEAVNGFSREAKAVDEKADKFAGAFKDCEELELEGTKFDGAGFRDTRRGVGGTRNQK